MLRKLKQFIDRLIYFKKASNLDDFGEIEVKLMKAMPKARSSFQQDLREKLKARHQELREEQVEKESGFFYVHRFATSMVLAMVLVVGGGGFMVSAADAPVPKNVPLSDTSPEWHPDVAPITIEFDQNMMRGSVEDAFSIYPAVEGSFVWDNNHKVRFLPDMPLDSNQEYVVTISQDARSFLQKPMSAEFEQKISVFSPELPAGVEEKLIELKALRDSTRGLSGDARDEIIQQIIEIEEELRLFFDPNDRPMQNQPNNQNAPNVQPSSA